MISWKDLKEWLFASKYRKIGLIVLVVVIVIISSFLAWALTPRGPMEEALDALGSDEEIKVNEGERYVFEPRDEEATTGFIIYPGARVDPRSYAPFAREIAREGFLVIIEPMTLNLAFFSQDAAADAMDAHPEVIHWVVGGHSHGGAMASNFAADEDVNGIVHWAAYPDDDISGRDLPALSIYGSKDGLSTVEEVEEARDKMPNNTTYVKIDGGNHAQFGWYGDHRGDGEATITREEQQRIVVEEQRIHHISLFFKYQKIDHLVDHQK